MANSVDPDETVRYKPSHLDLHCLHRHLFVCQAEGGGGQIKVQYASAYD